MFGEANVTGQAIQGFRRQTPWQRNWMNEFVQIKPSNCDEPSEISASDLDGLCVLIIDNSSYVAAGWNSCRCVRGQHPGPVATIAEAQVCDLRANSGRGHCGHHSPWRRAISQADRSAV